MNMRMKLTKYQQEMLDGKHGECKQFCMDKLVDFGEAVEATEMVDLVLVLNECPIWSKNPRNPKTLEKLSAYDLGHSRLYDPIFAMKDAHVADETGTACGNDPYMCQLDKVEEKGYPWNFEIPGKGSFKLDPEMVRDYKAGYDKLHEHGWLNWSSCNPYLNTRIPKMGEYAASSESSAACYINTVLGARTNRESPVNTIYAAYTGCLPKYGSYLDENRGAKCIVEVDDEVRDNMKGMADFGALGACIAAKAENRIMAVLNLPKIMFPGATKNLISCASPGMNDPILHLMGTTPESPTLEAAFKGKMPKNPERFTVKMDDIIEMYRYLNNLAPAPGPERAKPVDIVIVGCPHATFDEVREIARLVKGKKVKPGVQLWVQTDTPTYFMAQHYGDTKAIEDAGGKIYHQTCMAMTPFRHFPKNITIATSSFKYTKLCAGFGSEGTTWIYANPEALVNAAVTGAFTPTPRWDYWSQPREMRLASEKDQPLMSGTPGIGE
jgi:predicted aconitase